MEKNVGILPADAPLTISPATTTLPEMFRRNGYQTAIVGKWHLGLGTKDIPVDFNREIKEGPLAIGFDYAYYFRQQMTGYLAYISIMKSRWPYS